MRKNYYYYIISLFLLIQSVSLAQLNNLTNHYVINLSESKSEKLKKNRYHIDIFFKWTSLFVNIDDLETSAFNYTYNRTEVDFFNVKTNTIGHFSRPNVGVNIGYYLNKSMRINLQGSYYFESVNEHKQESTIKGDPGYGYFQNLKIRLSTFSIGPNMEIKISEGNSLLNRLSIIFGFNIDFHYLDLDFLYDRKFPPTISYINGFLDSKTIGISINLSAKYNFWKLFNIGFSTGYILGEFEHIKGYTRSSWWGYYDDEVELAIGRKNTGYPIRLHNTEHSYGADYRPAKIDINGLTFSLYLMYELP